MKRERNQITCRCGRLPFPHRFTKICDVWSYGGDDDTHGRSDEDELRADDERSRARDMNAELRKGTYR